VCVCVCVCMCVCYLVDETFPHWHILIIVYITLALRWCSAI